MTRYWKNAFYDKSTWLIEVLQTFDSAEEAYNREKEIISENKNNNNCLNLAEGGIGGRGMKGKKHSTDTRSLMSSAAKQAGNDCDLRETRSKNLNNIWNDSNARNKRIMSMNTPQAKENRANATKLRFAAERKGKIEKYRDDIISILSLSRNKSEVINNYPEIYSLLIASKDEIPDLWDIYSKLPRKPRSSSYKNHENKT